MNNTKEKIKSIVLILLICTSLFFTYRIWFEKKLWSGDYNFFSRTDKNFQTYIFHSNGESAKAFANAKNVLSMPALQMVSTPNGRAVIDDYEQLKEIYPLINNALRMFLELKSENVTESNEKEWQSALKTYCIYGAYSTEYDLESLSQILGIKKADNVFLKYTIKEFVILPADSIAGKVRVILKSNDEKYIKGYINMPPSQVEGIIEMATANISSNKKFSFELDFHKELLAEDGTPLQMVVISPMTMLELEAFPLTQYESRVSITGANGEIKADTLDDLVSLFAMNSNSSRKYVDKQGNIIINENYATLKVHKNGLIEYTAQEGKGIEISKGNSSATTATMATTFVNRVNTITKSHRDIVISNPFTSFSNKNVANVQMDFNYQLNSHICFVGDIFNPLSSNISVKVEDGKITNYTHYLKSFKAIGEKNQDSSLSVIDKIYEKTSYSENSLLNVESINLVYYDNISTLSASSKWYITLDNGTIFSIE